MVFPAGIAASLGELWAEGLCIPQEGFGLEQLRGPEAAIAEPGLLPERSRGLLQEQLMILPPYLLLDRHSSVYQGHESLSLLIGLCLFQQPRISINRRCFARTVSRLMRTTFAP